MLDVIGIVLLVVGIFVFFNSTLAGFIIALVGVGLLLAKDK